MPKIGGLFKKDVIPVLRVKGKAMGKCFLSSGKLSVAMQVQSWMCLWEVEMKGSKAQAVFLLSVVCFWRRDTQRVGKGCLWCCATIKTETESISGINACCGAVSGTALVWCLESLLIPSSLVGFSLLTSQKLLV